NIFYLTNFLGTAGIAVAMRDRLCPILDFPYAAAARDIWNTEFGCPDAEIVPVDRTYDETLVTLIKKLQPPRPGFEGTHRPLNRANHLAAMVGAGIQTASVSAAARPDNAGDSVSLVATDNVIERRRVVKDAHEIAMLRRGAELLAPVAIDILGDVKPGLKEQ